MWKKLISSKHNTPYWFNELTGKSSWEEPEECRNISLPVISPVAAPTIDPIIVSETVSDSNIHKMAASAASDNSTSRKRARSSDSEPVPINNKIDSSTHSGENPIAIEPNCPQELLWKRKYLFKGFEEEKVEGLRMDAVSAFSITEAQSAAVMTTLIWQALQETKLLNRNTLSDSCILDGMACVGGNTISFAGKFSRVLSNELDCTRYSMLQHNAKTVMSRNNVEFFNRSILELAFERNDYDIIFLDPEWGGPDYKEHDKLLLPISNQSMEEFCLNVLHRMHRVSVVALKLPLNYDNEFIQNFAKKNSLIYKFHTRGLKKMSLTILTKKKL